MPTFSEPWTIRWRDLVEFESAPVRRSKDAAEIMSSILI